MLEQIFFFFSQLIMTFVSLSIVDKSGRKALLVISATLMAVCYACLGGFYLIKTQNPVLAAELNWLPLLCIAVYISAFSIGYGPVPWVLMGEIYSSEVYKYTFYSYIILYLREQRKNIIKKLFNLHYIQYNVLNVKRS